MPRVRRAAVTASYIWGSAPGPWGPVSPHPLRTGSLPPSRTRALKNQYPKPVLFLRVECLTQETWGRFSLCEPSSWYTCCGHKLVKMCSRVANPTDIKTRNGWTRSNSLMAWFLLNKLCFAPAFFCTGVGRRRFWMVHVLIWTFRRQARDRWSPKVRIELIG